MNKVVFLDRDGTVNVEKNYLYRIEDFEFIDGVPEAIKLLNDAGYLVIVVTNQAGIGRGYYTEEDMHILHRHIDKELKKYEAHIDAYYYCPHHPEYGMGEYKKECDCRKPRSGMLWKALEENSIIDIKNSYIVGDKENDIIAGKGIGIQGILVRSGHKIDEDQVKDKVEIQDSLFKAVCKILNYNR